MSEPLEVFESVFGQVEALVYRCRNDADYTMDYISGQVEALSGYSRDDILGNKCVSWAGIIHPEDIDRVNTEVDAAIDRKTSWDVDYRLVRRDGGATWIRERGGAVFENGKLLYLQGLVVGAEAELHQRQEAQTVVKAAEAEKQVVANKIAQEIVRSVSKLTMLSINARIEAAHSGEYGRGFAVVADEIRRLAGQNGDLARQISELMGTSDGDVPEQDNPSNPGQNMAA